MDADEAQINADGDGGTCVQEPHFTGIPEGTGPAEENAW